MFPEIVSCVLSGLTTIGGPVFGSSLRFCRSSPIQLFITSIKLVPAASVTPIPEFPLIRLRGSSPRSKAPEEVLGPPMRFFVAEPPTNMPPLDVGDRGRPGYVRSDEAAEDPIVVCLAET